MSTSNLNINIDSELKDKAKSVFESLGIDMSTAISMLLHKELYSQEMPLINLEKSFEKKEKKDRRAAFGCLKGKIHVPDDFNEPLDDFNEYM